MRTVFIGTPEFAVQSLAGLLDRDIDVCLVVTKPDKRSGRGRRLTRPAVKDFAIARKLTVYQPLKLSSDEGCRLLKRLRPDIGVMVAYGEILAPELTGIFPQGVLNVHASLLPEYRGAAPISHALLAGEEYTGVTVQKVVPRVDAGPILAQKKIKIGADENAGELHDRLAGLGALCLVEVVCAIASGESLPERMQNPDEASFAPKLSKKDGRIDWSRSAESIFNCIRGLTPWPGAYCRYAGRKHEVKVTVTEARPAGPVREAEPGTIVDITDEGEIVVAAGDGCGVCIRALKPAGGRVMKSEDFVHGRHVAAGDRFT